MNENFDEILNRLKAIEHQVQVNQAMLNSIQRRARLAIIFSFIKWTVIIGLTLGTFYYTQPYIERAMDLYDQVYGLTNTIKGQQEKTQSMYDQFKSYFK